VYRDVWHRIEVVDESVALVGSVRRAGYGVHLGTNQERERGEHKRDALGYDALFDDPVVPRRRPRGAPRSAGEPGRPARCLSSVRQAM
jgi:hypothetical protein